jgi:ribosomal protein S18 acetylase RimI-like enzyme
VAPGFRGRGLARALLSRVSAGLQNGLARNLVLTVTTENTVARSLYYGSNAALLDTERAYVRRMPDDAHGESPTPPGGYVQQPRAGLVPA